MIVLPVQWDKHAGPTVMGQHKFIFEVDESIDLSDFNPLKIKKGTQFMMILLESEKDQILRQETETETKQRFTKYLHAVISDYAKLEGRRADEVKDELKKQLIEEGKIKESSKELDINGIAYAIYLMKAKLRKYGEGY